jgi:hypothetical protein
MTALGRGKSALHESMLFFIITEFFGQIFSRDTNIAFFGESLMIYTSRIVDMLFRGSTVSFTL